MENEMKEQLYRDMTSEDVDLYRTLLDSRSFQMDGLHLLNASVVPVGVDGIWDVREVSPIVAYRLHLAAASGDAMYAGVASHIGHEGTAQAITSLHGIGVEVDRSPWDGKGIGLAFTLKARQREGEILTYERVMEVGFVWRVLMKGPPESRRCGSCKGELKVSDSTGVLLPCATCGSLLHESNRL